MGTVHGAAEYGAGLARRTGQTENAKPRIGIECYAVEAFQSRKIEAFRAENGAGNTFYPKPAKMPFYCVTETEKWGGELYR